MYVHSILAGGYSCNSYILVNKETNEAAIIDPGLNGDQIIAFLEEEGLVPTGIYLTHGHYDHIEHIPTILEKYPNLDVFIHELEKEFLVDKKLNCAYLMHFAHDVKIDNVEPILYKEGDIIEMAHKQMKVIYTPYHTIGSSCFYCEKENIVFSGDSLFRRAIGRSDLPTGSRKTVKSSLEKLIALPQETVVYPGHGKTTTIGDEQIHNIFFPSKRGI